MLATAIQIITIDCDILSFSQCWYLWRLKYAARIGNKVASKYIKVIQVDLMDCDFCHSV